MGQATVELLMATLLMLALVASVASSLSQEARAVRAKAGDLRAQCMAESSVRAAEAALAGGARIEMWPGGLLPAEAGGGWRIEGGLLRIPSGDGVLEVRGVFNEDASEPV